MLELFEAAPEQPASKNAARRSDKIADRMRLARCAAGVACVRGRLGALGAVGIVGVAGVLGASSWCNLFILSPLARHCILRIIELGDILYMQRRPMNSRSG